MAEAESQSEALALLALEASGAGVWSWSVGDDYIVADARYRALYGFIAGEVISPESWQARVHPDDIEQVRQNLSDCLDHGRHWRQSFRIAHPDRGLRLIEVRGQPWFSDDGSVGGLTGLNIDVTDAGGPRSLREAHLKAVLDSAIDGIITIDEKGVIQTFNPAAERIFGYPADSVIGRNVSILMPDPDRSAHDRYISSYMSGGKAKIIGVGREVTGQRADGTLFPLDLGITEIKDGSRRQFVGIVRDVTERKRAEATQSLLIDELNHRVKNTLVTVQAMAEQTWRATLDPDRFVTGFRGRLQALSRAHNLLTKGTWHGVDIGELISEQLTLGAGLEDQISVEGPPVDLPSQVAVHLGLVLHELGTNARKYGALSVASGRLAVRWTLEEAEPGRLLRLTWVESGGPRVSKPSRPGFGTVLIERGIRHTLRGDTVHSFAEDGVRCEITLPLD